MAISAEAQAEYERVLKLLVLKHGSLALEDPSIYGWVDYRYYTYANKGQQLHHVICKITSSEVPKEDHWREFNGTFNDEDDSVHGIVLKGVSCACGKLKNREFRWTERMQRVAELVFEEAFGRRNDAN